MNQVGRTILGLLLLFAFTIVACTPQAASPSATATPQGGVRIGLLLARGGLGDRSFSDSAYAGLQEAQRRYDITFRTADFTTDEENLESLRNFARQNFDLIIGLGFENATYIETVAKEFPEHRFAIIDTVVEGENVSSVIYRESEGDFLMGVLAAMLSESEIVGFVGGADIPVIRRIESGFKQGVAHQNSDVEVLAELAGSFSEPALGKEIALRQYNEGADIIYHAAGRTGLGVIEAAVEQDKRVMGTSTLEGAVPPYNIVGNRPKRVDTAVLLLVQELVEQGTVTPGTRSLGLKEEGLSIGPFNQDVVTNEMLQHLEELEQQIISGEIVIEE